MNKCIIIAEAGVNHNGNLDMAIKLCDAAKEVGADVVKFQTWITEKIITHNVAQADYQVTNTGIRESQFEMLKKLELTQDEFMTIKKHCDDIGIIFASTADEKESLDFLVDLGIPFIKIGSGDMRNIPFLRYVGGKGLPVLLSTGMSNLEEIKKSITVLREGGANDITALHCTTNYPCPYVEVNLRAMQTLKDVFRLPVGYSDHTLGSEVAIAAVGLGASVIEKHFTLDRYMVGPDHMASTEPEEFKGMVERIRHIEQALGDGKKSPTESERSIAKVVTKRIVAARQIAKGSIITEEDICVKRNNSGADAIRWDEIVGTKATKDYRLDEGVGD